MLERVHDALWVADGEIVDFHGFPYPTRSVIARFENGDLWNWSPVKLDKVLRAEIDKPGRVRHLVSPNKLHTLYLQDWKAAYPEAQLWGPQSTITKRRDIGFREALEDIAPAEWGSGIAQAWFRGSFATDEVVFLHRPSRTVIVADLIETLTDSFLRKHWRWWGRLLARLDGIVADKALVPAEWRWSFLNRRPACAARARASGRTSSARNCTTLGFLRAVAARMAPKSRSCVSTT